MLKSHSWSDKVTVALCWKFFKYKLVLDTTRGKLIRDRNLLTSESLVNILSDRDIGIPANCKSCDIDAIAGRMSELKEDIELLLSPLKEITQMISPFKVIS